VEDWREKERNKTQTAVINMEPGRMLSRVDFLDASCVRHASSEVTVGWIAVGRRERRTGVW